MGNTLVPRQGGQIAVLDGRPTLMGGFYDYDKYPDIVEQFHVDSGGGHCPSNMTLCAFHQL